MVFKVQLYLFVFNLATFWAVLALFRPFENIFEVGCVQNIFGTYLHRLANFILEVKLYRASLKLSQVWGWLDLAMIMITKLSAFDFDFDWRVCQNLKRSKIARMSIYQGIGYYQDFLCNLKLVFICGWLTTKTRRTKIISQTTEQSIDQ